MKRTLTEAHTRVQSAMKRLEDLEVIHPGAALSLQRVVAVDLQPALEAIQYARELPD